MGTGNGEGGGAGGRGADVSLAAACWRCERVLRQFVAACGKGKGFANRCFKLEHYFLVLV